MSLVSYKQHIFGRFWKEKEELRMKMEDNTLLLHKQAVLSANVLCTLYVTPLYSKCIRSLYSHTLANIESFADYFKKISSCLLMERKKGWQQSY